MLRSMGDLEGYAIGATDGVVGHARDLYIDDEAWIIRYFVVETGGWLSNRKVLISPFAVGKPSGSERVLPVSLTREKVKNSPDIDHVHASDGDIGHVQDMLVDDETWAIRHLVVNTSDWWLGHKVLVASQWIDSVRWLDAKVSVDVTWQAVKDSPPFIHTAPLDRPQEASLYELRSSQLLGGRSETRNRDIAHLEARDPYDSRAHCSSHQESNMLLKQRIRHQHQSSKLQTLVVAVSATLSLGFAGPLLAAPSTQLVAAASDAPASSTAAADTKPDHACMGDLRTFSEQMQKDGYWLRGSDLGYGYPLYGYGYGYASGHGYGELGTTGSDRTVYPGAYSSARPGYEIRMLVGSASILAERGESEACRAVLGAARNLYGRYAADLREGKVPRADLVGWKRRQLASAKPVAASERAYRSDQLIGTDVLTPKGEDLGSVSDLVTSPKTGKISYLVVGRGGIFGIGEKYIPVPWDSFKATPGLGMLVLDTTKGAIDAAPQVRRNEFAPHGDFASQSAKVDAYWKGKLRSSK